MIRVVQFTRLPVLRVGRHFGQVDIEEANPRHVQRLVGPGDVLRKCGRSQSTGDERVNRADFLIEKILDRKFGQRLALRQLQYLAPFTGQPETLDRRQRHSLQHPVDREVQAVLRPTIGMRDTALGRVVEIEHAGAMVRIQLKEQRLIVCALSRPHGKISSELRRREHGCYERLGCHREVQIGSHGPTPLSSQRDVRRSVAAA